MAGELDKYVTTHEVLHLPWSITKTSAVGSGTGMVAAGWTVGVLGYEGLAIEEAHMPSPIGHMMAGYSVYAMARGQFSAKPGYVLALAVFSAIAADFDFIPGLLQGQVARFHQGGSHSLGAVFLYTAGIWLMLRCCKIAQANSLALLFGSAYASHVLLDFFGADSGPPIGIPLFWPFLPGYYTSPLSIFMEIHRHERGMVSFLMSGFTAHNLLAAAWEIAVLAPVAWWAHRVGKTAQRRDAGSADAPLCPAFDSVASSKETDR